MDLSKIKLVVTDMDGTLLNSSHQVSSRFFNVYKELVDQHGIIFVAASGRQYYSIVSKLASIKNEIYFIAENGALTMHQQNELDSVEIPIETYLNLLKLEERLHESQIIICGKRTAYTKAYSKEFIELCSEFYERYEIVDNFANIQDTIFKIAICNTKGTEEHVYPIVKHLENELKVKISGKIWLDISHVQANKGNALQKLQTNLGITAAQTMVFGDYNNDLEMMEAATYSFAMKNAHPNVLKAANYRTESNANYGVERIMEKVLEAKIKAQTTILSK
ncbi:HAD family hydrolase [Aquimarina sp. W85]|uniref:HAD family hydrolase n=1 Tax=Aquimarina rhodophyticola TaxID=3342246 RepID=UPI00366FA49F